VLLSSDPVYGYVSWAFIGMGWSFMDRRIDDGIMIGFGELTLEEGFALAHSLVVGEIWETL
jgi:hypothetical protein